MNLQGVRRKLLISILLAVVVVAGLLFYGDIRKVGSSLEDFRWELAPLILFIALGNYLLRFLKWQYYLGKVGVSGLRVWDSFLIYMSGLGMTITPAKVGEWLKCYLLKEIHGTPVTRSTPILFAERMTDALALMLLALVGVVLFEASFWPLAVAVAGVSAVVIAISRHKPTMDRLVSGSRRLPLIGRYTQQVGEMADSNYLVMDPVGAVLMTLVSVAAWGAQVVAFYIVLIGLGVDGGTDTFARATFILSISTLAAGLLLVPGGLGVAETGITTLCVRLLDMSSSAATAATLLIRIATLWFAVFLGLIAFVILLRRESVGMDAEPDRGEHPLIASSDPAG